MKNKKSVKKNSYFKTPSVLISTLSILYGLLIVPFPDKTVTLDFIETAGIKFVSKLTPNLPSNIPL